MVKIQVEVCLVSARGLRRSSSFWKLQWFAVGWIIPDQKYCSRIDSSGSSNPSWRTKFSVTIDASETNLQDLCLTVEVRSREPLFLKERLYGTATIQLKEFFSKFANTSESFSSGIEEVGSFQLRKKKSKKPLGFVDVSIRISEDKPAISSNIGIEDGTYRLPDDRYDFPVNTSNRPAAAYYPSHQRPNNGQTMNYSPTMAPSGNSQAGIEEGTYILPDDRNGIRVNTSNRPANVRFPSHRYSRPNNGQAMNYPPTMASTSSNVNAPPPNYSTMSTSNQRPAPPPPPPPSHVGFMPTFLPPSGPLPQNYINMPPSAAGGQAGGSGLGMGLGAGALAAGAVIFGDDFMSGFDYNGGSLTVSTDPPV